MKINFLKIYFLLGEVGETSTSLETKVENNQTRQQTIEKVVTNKKEKDKPIIIKKIIKNRDRKYINTIENTLTLDF